MALVALWVPALVFAHVYAAYFLARTLLIMRPRRARRAAAGAGAAGRVWRGALRRRRQLRRPCN